MCGPQISVRGRPGQVGWRRQGGFTLVELLVAMTLLSLVSVIIVSAFQSGMSVWQRGDQSSQANRELLALDRFLRGRLATVGGSSRTIAGRIPLMGAARTLTFTAPLPDGVGRGGLYRFNVEAAPQISGGRRLVVNWRLDMTDSETSDDASGQVVLLDQVGAVRFEYFGDPEREYEPAWRSSWEARHPPDLVRLVFQGGDHGRRPEMVFALPVKRQTTCEYNPLTKRCDDA